MTHAMQEVRAMTRCAEVLRMGSSVWTCELLAGHAADAADAPAFAIVGDVHRNGHLTWVSTDNGVIAQLYDPEHPPRLPDATAFNTPTAFNMRENDMIGIVVFDAQETTVQFVQLTEYTSDILDALRSSIEANLRGDK